MGKGPRLPIAAQRSQHARNPASSEPELSGKPHELALIQQICDSEPFRKAPEQKRLLRFLFQTRNDGLVADSIEEQFFRRTDESDPPKDPAHTRERISKLRARLTEFEKEHPLNVWRCWLPEPVGMSGYGLVIDPTPWSAPKRFWMHQLRTAADVKVITGTHLFFFNREQKTILRYSDVNMFVEPGAPVPRKADEQARMLDFIRSLHPNADLKDFVPWPNTYLASGDVMAYEHLSAWFHGETGVLLKRYTSHEILRRDIEKATPIFIGRTETNLALPPFSMTINAGNSATGLSIRTARQEFAP